MSIFDKARESLGAKAGGSEESTLSNNVLEMLGQGGIGGLANLVKQFQAQGLGEIISSWISTGQNLPISAEQLQRGIGSDLLKQLAAKAGLAPEQASSKLAEILPAFIDKLTPNGKLPESGMLEQGLKFLKSKLS